MPFSRLLDEPPTTEKRKDRDGLRYTKLEFFKYYGSRKGQDMWAMARPDDEIEVACARSLVEATKLENSMLMDAVHQSSEEREREGIAQDLRSIAEDFEPNCRERLTKLKQTIYGDAEIQPPGIPTVLFTGPPGTRHMF